MGLFDNIFKKPKKEDVKKGETPQTSQLSTNTTSSISSANGYEKLSRIVNESSERTAEVLAGRDAKEKVAMTYSDYAENVLISDLDSAFDNAKARAAYVNNLDEVTFENVSREIQDINDLMQEITQLDEQERFDSESIATSDTKDFYRIYLSGLLKESEKHLAALKSRYRSEPTTTREDFIKEMTEEFQIIDGMLKGKDADKKTSKVEEKPTISDDERLRSEFYGLAKSAKRRVDSDMGKTQEKPKEPMSLDDLLSGPML